MTDDCLSGLMLVSGGKDLVDKLASDDIINRCAAMSPVLTKILICS